MKKFEMKNELSWVQRAKIAAALYKSDWRGAVSAAPEELRPALQQLCDERSLRELAEELDPASDGVLVDAADCHVPLHGMQPRTAY